MELHHRLPRRMDADDDDMYIPTMHKYKIPPPPFILALTPHYTIELIEVRVDVLSPCVVTATKIAHITQPIWMALTGQLGQYGQQ